MPKIKGYRVPITGAKSSDLKGKSGLFYARTKSHSIPKKRK